MLGQLPGRPGGRACRSQPSSRARSRSTACRQTGITLRAEGLGRGMPGAGARASSWCGSTGSKASSTVQPRRPDEPDPSSTGRMSTPTPVQSCVVTFEPVPAQVDAEFDRLFSREVPGGDGRGGRDRPRGRDAGAAGRRQARSRRDPGRGAVAGARPLPAVARGRSAAGRARRRGDDRRRSRRAASRALRRMRAAPCRMTLP